MRKRPFTFESVSAFQAKLEGFFKSVQTQKEQESKNIDAYRELVYQYHIEKKMSIREIAKATGIPNSTIYSWIRIVKKQKETVQPNA